MGRKMRLTLAFVLACVHVQAVYSNRAQDFTFSLKNEPKEFSCQVGRLITGEYCPEQDGEQVAADNANDAANGETTQASAKVSAPGADAPGISTVKEKIQALCSMVGGNCHGPESFGEPQMKAKTALLPFVMEQPKMMKGGYATMNEVNGSWTLGATIVVNMYQTWNYTGIGDVANLSKSVEMVREFTAKCNDPQWPRPEEIQALRCKDKLPVCPHYKAHCANPNVAGMCPATCNACPTCKSKKAFSETYDWNAVVTRTTCQEMATAGLCSVKGWNSMTLKAFPDCSTECINRTDTGYAAKQNKTDAKLALAASEAKAKCPQYNSPKCIQDWARLGVPRSLFAKYITGDCVEECGACACQARCTDMILGKSAGCDNFRCPPWVAPGTTCEAGQKFIQSNLCKGVCMGGAVNGEWKSALPIPLENTGGETGEFAAVKYRRKWVLRTLTAGKNPAAGGAPYTRHFQFLVDSLKSQTCFWKDELFNGQWSCMPQSTTQVLAICQADQMVVDEEQVYINKNETCCWNTMEECPESLVKAFDFEQPGQNYYLYSNPKTFKKFSANFVSFE